MTERNDDDSPDFSGFSATYSPEDNKLRLSAASRLSPELYARVKAAGFSWAPKQEIFVAPAWSPEREDLLLELCGEIDAEDTTAEERAADRAERFEGYRKRRADEAHRARKAVSAIADNIPMGQPILVGHHSERHARKDADRIENGMRKAVNLWKTSEYWQRRARAAMSHAGYLSRPDVRARRIKTLEAEQRKAQRSRDEVEKRLKFWAEKAPTMPLETVRKVAGLREYSLYLPQIEGQSWSYSSWDALQPDETRPKGCPAWTVQQFADYAAAKLPTAFDRADRWLEHYANRIAYERAQLAEQIGTADPGERFPFEVGGLVLVRSEWCPIVKVTKRAGKVLSLTVARRYVPRVGPEEVKDYRAPTAEQAAQVKAATALPPLCNYPAQQVDARRAGSAESLKPRDAIPLTRAQWDKIYADHKGTRTIAATDTAGAHRVRAAAGFVLRRFLADPQAIAADEHYSTLPVFLTDAPVKMPPAPAKDPRPAIPAPEPIPREVYKRAEPTPEAAEFHAMAETLRAGVQVVAAPQLFPTPPEIARRLVESAGLEPGASVLEPSAGTGRILEALPEGCDVVAVERVHDLCSRLAAKFERARVCCADFLSCEPGGLVGTHRAGENPAPLGSFDAVLMNPPFENGADIKHIQHAAQFLKPGGRLVALCANGSRQNAQLKPWAEESGGIWEELPPNSFAASGTGVNVALLVYEAPAAKQPAPQALEQAELF
jgi:protein-L-isoaspartate O-methyltransferase